MDFRLFILNIFAHGRKARASTAYFVLCGKKTNSVLSYGHFYHLLPYFHLCPQLKKEDYWQALHSLVQQGLLKQDGDFVQLTARGKSCLAQVDFLPYADLNYGLAYKMIQHVYTRWLFVQQILSEYAYQERHYFPLTTQFAEQQAVRACMKKWPQPTNTCIQFYYKEMQALLTQLTPRQQQLWQSDWIGHHYYGQAKEEVAQVLAIPTAFAYFLEKESLKSKLYACYKKSAFLQQLLQLQEEESPLKQKIRQANKAGWSLAQMSQAFHKKPGTIFDYLVECAIFDADFPFALWLPPKKQKALKAYLRIEPDVALWSYAQVQAWNAELDFYSFRLFQIAKEK